jgi:hypothetical protein
MNLRVLFGVSDIRDSNCSAVRCQWWLSRCSPDELASKDAADQDGAPS